MKKEKGIDLHPFFYPLSSQPSYFVFASACEERGRNMVSFRVWGEFAERDEYEL